MIAARDPGNGPGRPRGAAPGTPRAPSSRRRPAARRPAPRQRAMRSQRSGDCTTRRSDGNPRASRNRAVTPLAAIMRSSISSLARFGACGRRSRSVSPSNTGCDLDRLEVERAVLVARARAAPARRRPACAAARPARHCRGRRRQRTARRQPRADARCRRASRGCAPARRRRPTLRASPSGATTTSR